MKANLMAKPPSVKVKFFGSPTQMKRQTNSNQATNNSSHCNRYSGRYRAVRLCWSNGRHSSEYNANINSKYTQETHKFLICLRIMNMIDEVWIMCRAFFGAVVLGFFLE